MNELLRNKKFVIFVGLKHHYNKLRPVINRLQEFGSIVKLVTSRNVSSKYIGNRECFEKYLIEQKIDYLHLYDLKNNEVYYEAKKQVKFLFGKITTYFKNQEFFPFDQFEPYELEMAIKDAVESRLLFKKLLEIETPDMVGALHEINFWAKLLFMEADKKNIPSLSLQEGFYQSDERRSQKYRYIADYSSVAVWGENSKRTLLKFNCPAEHIIITGNAEYDELFNRVYQKRKYSKKNIRKKVLIALPNPYWAYEQAIPIERLGAALENDKDFDVFIKWHPREAASFSNRAKELLENYNFKSFFSENLENILPDMDLCITLDSSVGLDALLYNIPLIEMNFSNINYGRSYSAEGVALLISSFKDLYKIKEVLENKTKTVENDCLDTFIINNFYKTDGKSLNRVIELIENKLTNK